MELCGINERFDNESDLVKEIRVRYAEIADKLYDLRQGLERWNPAARHYSIAITDLEDSCMRAIKWLYTK